MANFVSAGQLGSFGGFDAYAFDIPSQSTINFFQERLQSMGNIGDAFFTRANQALEQFCGSEAIAAAKSLVRTAQHLFTKDVIMPLTTLSQIQQAKAVMQRFIMAAPIAREYYHRQQCDGYSSSYVDQYPGAIGEKHPDWQVINNGLVQFDHPDEDVDWSAKTYMFIDDDESELSLREQVFVVKDTWDALVALMEPGREDPTSPWCGKL